MIDELLAKQRRQEQELYKLPAWDESSQRASFDTLKRIIDIPKYKGNLIFVV